MLYGNCEELCDPALVPSALMLRLLWVRSWMMADWTGCQSAERQLQDAVAKDGVLIYWHLAEYKFLFMREGDTNSYTLKMKQLRKYI